MLRTIIDMLMSEEAEVCLCDIMQTMAQGWTGIKDDTLAAALENKLGDLHHVEVLDMGMAGFCTVCGSGIMAVKYRRRR